MKRYTHGSFTKHLLLLLALVLPTLNIQAQISGNIPLGTWRIHASYYGMRLVQTTSAGVYGCAGAASIFVDFEDNSVNAFSKLNGLSDTRVSAINFDDNGKILVVGYETGNIDLVDAKGKITNLNAIVRREITSSKKINHIHIHNNRAYLSTDFGLVVVNIQRAEIAFSNLDLGRRAGKGPLLKVYASTVYRDSLFLGTDQGVMGAPLSANLMDTDRFKTFTEESGLPVQKDIPLIPLSINGNLLVAAVSASNEVSGIYGANGLKFARLRFVSGIRSFNVSKGRVILCNTDGVEIINPLSATSDSVYRDTMLISPQMAQFDDDNRIWIADNSRGLVYRSPKSEYRTITTNGPYSAQTIKLVPYKDRMLACPGGYSGNFYAPLFNTSGYAEFVNNQWYNYSVNLGNLVYCNDIVDAAYDPTTDDLYLASYGSGLIQKRKNGIPGRETVYNETNSPLYNEIPGAPQCRVTGIYIDSKGNRWMTNFLSRLTPLLRWGVNNTWSTFRFSNDSWSQFPQQLSPAGNGDDIWVRFPQEPGYRPGGPIWAFSERSGSKMVTDAPNAGNLPSSTINDLARDNDGVVWVGTDKGLAVYYSPSGVIRNNNFNATWPIFNGRYLLEDEALSAVCIDGGGRKWLGTKNNGVWLFNKDLSRIEAIFNTANSPLISNRIIDIAILETTGEVFFATEDGIVSYRGNATTGGEECTDLKVFPNPARPEYTGDIAISGLPENALVKVTDVAGRMVYQAKANGGMFTWNRKTYQGDLAVTGVYTAMVSNADGTAGCNVRFAVITK